MRSRDPFRGDRRISGEGPVLSVLAAEKFAEVKLFYNSDEFLKRASDVLRALRDQGDETPVTYVPVPVVDPTNHGALYEQIEDRVLEISEEVGAKAYLWIAVSSGTPQMQTCWMLLVLGGIIKARLIQVLPPLKIRFGEPVWRETFQKDMKFGRFGIWVVRKKNGELLKLMTGHFFELFITVGRNLPYQHSFPELDFRESFRPDR